MERRGNRSARLVLVVSFIALAVLVPHVVMGDTRAPEVETVVVIDGRSLAEADQGAGFASSFVGLLAALEDDRPMTLLSASEPRTAMGPFTGSDPGFGEVQEDIERVLGALQPGGDAAILLALAEAHTIFGAAQSPRGSSVYLVTGDYPDADFDQLRETLAPLITRFADKGWPIFGVSLPGASESATGFLRTVSAQTGGRSYELTVPHGFTQLINSLLKSDARGSLAEVGGGDLRTSDLLAASVSIAPGTSETTLYVFKESPYGSLRLSNPGGFESSAGDRTASYVIETPHVVIWRLVDPAPGNWRIDVRGVEGVLSAWERSTNKYELLLNSPDTVPLSVPGTLVGHIREGESVAFVNDVRMSARITTPNGATVLHEMKDDGKSGDAIADDGFYTATLAPLTAGGRYDVELELSWLEFDHIIRSQTSFEAAAFPAIEVWTGELDGLPAGERSQIATAFVHVQGEPYPVDIDEFVVSLASPEESEGILEIEPRRLFGTGPAWEYQVYFTPSAAGHHTVMFRLALDYAGREYTHSTGSFVLSSVAAPPAPSAVVEAPVVEAPAAEPAAEPVLDVPAPLALPPLGLTQPPPARTDGFEPPLLLLAIAGGLLLVGAAVVAYLMTRPRPFGYLYDDQEEPVVDFGGLQRRPIMALIRGSTVRGGELGIQGLESLVFHFSRAGVKIRSESQPEEGPTVRVNNQPLTQPTEIEHKSWIGIGGKLYSFLVSPPLRRWEPVRETTNQPPC